LLDAPEDSFLKRPGKGPNPGTAAWVSVRGEAERLLAGLSRQGLEFYQLTHEVTARTMLREASASQDLAQVSEVARRFRFTPSGSDALNLLGTYYLDRGRADLAGLCFHRLLEFPGTDKLSSLTLFKAALAFAATGDQGRQQQTWQALQRRLASEGLRLGGQPVPADALLAEIDRWRNRSRRDSDWLLYRGNPERGQTGQADIPLLEPLWRRGTSVLDSSRQLIRQARQEPADLPLLPAAVPLHVAGRVIARSQGGLLALDGQTGKPLWHTGLSLSLESILADPGRKVQLEHWLRNGGLLETLLFRNSVLSTLSSDGVRVYAIDDLPLPPPPLLLAEMDNGRKRAFSTLKGPIYHNRLAAVDVQSGRLVWKAGGRGLGVPAELADAYFLGPPLPLGSDLFALVEQKQDLYLVCLDAEKGEVHWRQHLASPTEKVLVTPQRRTQALHLAYGDGLLICPTHSGGVVAFDVLSRRLVWAQTYVHSIRLHPADLIAGAPLDPADFTFQPVAWLGCPPLVQADRVILAPIDADSISCLALKTGEQVWKTDRAAEDLYVAAVHGGKVLVVGRSSCRALSLTTGQQLWERTCPTPAGQGVLCLDPAGSARYYLPLESGDLLVLDLEQPQASTSIARRGSHRLGNLISLGDKLWSQTPEELAAFVPLRSRLAQIEEQLRFAPEDAGKLLERARLRLDRGEPAAAVADLRRARKRLAESAASSRMGLAGLVRQTLYEALTDLLRRDFAAGEPYLDEYRELCRVPIPPNASQQQRAVLLREERQRHNQLLVLLARRQEEQGRLADALALYRQLYDQANPEDLLPVLNESSLRLRADLWAQERVAELFRRSAGNHQALLRAAGFIPDVLDRRDKPGGSSAWQALKESASTEQIERWLDLFEQVPSKGWPMLLDARAELMESWSHTRDRRLALAASYRLSRIIDRAEDPALRARAQLGLARLLTEQGYLEDAAECYRRLSREHGREILPGGLTGAQVLQEMGTDKRLLAFLGPPRPAWEGQRFRGVEAPGGLSLLRSLVCVPLEDTFLALEGETSASQLDNRPAVSCRNYRFLFDVPNCRLVVQSRDTGMERWSLRLPGPSLNDGQPPNVMVFDHLALLLAKELLVAIDLMERRVLWSRNLSEPGTGNELMIRMPDGSVQLLGLVGPIGRSALCIRTRSGLLALDPLTGKVRWQRSDILPRSGNLLVAEHHLFLVEYQGASNAETGNTPVRSVRAFWLLDGKSVPIPDAARVLTECKRLLGQCVLTSEQGEKKQLVLRLYDLVQGKDLWKQTYPADSRLLPSFAPELVAVLQPDGRVALTDLRAERDGVPSSVPKQLVLEAKHRQGILDGLLLQDAGQLYLVLNYPPGGAGALVEDVNPYFTGELSSTRVDGLLYAFDRTTGARRWFQSLSPQYLLLNRFDELPLILCASIIMRQTDPNKPVSQEKVLMSIDKRTGKLCYHRETPGPPNDPYQTLLVDPRKGVIELLGARTRFRHTVQSIEQR
jgi:outer membrane protein assembly factor BamB/tetratricopeptide (TPR) repeat protein